MDQGTGHHHGCGHLLFLEEQGGVEEGSSQHTVDHQEVGHADHEADLWRASQDRVPQDGCPLALVSSPTRGSRGVP